MLVYWEVLGHPPLPPAVGQKRATATIGLDGRRPLSARGGRPAATTAS